MHNYNFIILGLQLHHAIQVHPEFLLINLITIARSIILQHQPSTLVDAPLNLCTTIIIRTSIGNLRIIFNVEELIIVQYKLLLYSHTALRGTHIRHIYMQHIHNVMFSTIFNPFICSVSMHVQRLQEQVLNITENQQTSEFPYIIFIGTWIDHVPFLQTTSTLELRTLFST